MTEPKPSLHEGHRERLRARFIEHSENLSEAELLELLLSYAIPRKDVAPLAQSLLEQAGSIPALLTLAYQDLANLPGLGESSAAYLKALEAIMKLNNQDQPPLFETNPGEESARPSPARTLRVFANDEIQNSINFLPKAISFSRIEEFKQFLENNLPYNSTETRRRRANYILDRFYPENHLNTPLTFFLKNCADAEALKPVIFYHVLKSEPIAVKLAEELIYPALPVGRVERTQIREFVLKYLPEASDSSQKNMLRAFFYTYGFLGVGSVYEDTLRFKLHSGILDSFVYILTCEFATAGIYSFDQLYQSPAHRWLLWDKEWMRDQLFNLRDAGILSKISEIDSVKQFSLEFDQSTALQRYFDAHQAGLRNLREKPDEPDLT